jgi:hypothetical protein
VHHTQQYRVRYSARALGPPLFGAPEAQVDRLLPSDHCRMAGTSTYLSRTSRGPPSSVRVASQPQVGSLRAAHCAGSSASKDE